VLINCVVQGICQVAARVLLRVAANDVLAVSTFALQIMPQPGAPFGRELGSLRANELNCGCRQVAAVGRVCLESPVALIKLYALERPRV